MLAQSARPPRAASLHNNGGEVETARDARASYTRENGNLFIHIYIGFLGKQREKGSYSQRVYFKEPNPGIVISTLYIWYIT